MLITHCPGRQPRNIHSFIHSFIEQLFIHHLLVRYRAHNLPPKYFSGIYLLASITIVIVLWTTATGSLLFSLLPFLTF